jgi:hypothetical protein
VVPKKTMDDNQQPTPESNKYITLTIRGKILGIISRIEDCSKQSLERSISREKREFLEMEEKMLRGRLNELKIKYKDAFMNE